MFVSVVIGNDKEDNINYVNILGFGSRVFNKIIDKIQIRPLFGKQVRRGSLVIRPTLATSFGQVFLPLRACPF